MTAAIILLVNGCAHHHPRPSQAGASKQTDLIGRSEDGLRAALIASERKAVMGRRESLGDIHRVLWNDDPIVRAATMLPDVQPTLRKMARDDKVGVDQVRERWALLQDADILIESGGDPEAVSSAGAVGVSQWMPGPGTKHGLFAVNLAQSSALTTRIEDLKWRLAWFGYWRTPGHDGPVEGLARVRPAEAAAEMPSLEAKLAKLREERALVDGRYDPTEAIQAQTRYLLGLYDRFPSVDWLFQAYHGGEAGVDRLVKRYLGREWPGSTAQAIRTGDAGKPLTFERVFENAVPSPSDPEDAPAAPLSGSRGGADRHPAAFLYLYGRGDDHRHYWWKILAAAEALQLYRRDPVEFRRQWTALAPGRSIAATWYPTAGADMLGSVMDIRKATARGRLVAVTNGDGRIVGSTAGQAPEIVVHAMLAPQAEAALDQVVGLYRLAGGAENPRVVRMTSTRAEAEAIRAAVHPVVPPRDRIQRPMPPDLELLPGSGPPPGFDYHTIGVAFDFMPPGDRMDREILTYVLDMLKERRTLQWYVDRNEGQTDRWVVIASPSLR